MAQNDINHFIGMTTEALKQASVRLDKHDEHIEATQKEVSDLRNEMRDKFWKIFLAALFGSALPQLPELLKEIFGK